MGGESMQCLVEVETQSFEIKHFLPSHSMSCSHHVTLKWIRVPFSVYLVTSKSLTVFVGCKLTQKIKTHRQFFAKKTVLPFFTKRWNPEKDRNEATEGVEPRFLCQSSLVREQPRQCLQPDDFSDLFSKKNCESYTFVQCCIIGVKTVSHTYSLCLTRFGFL